MGRTRSPRSGISDPRKPQPLPMLASTPRPTCARSAQMRLIAAILRSGTGPHFIAYDTLVMGLQGRPWNDCAGEGKAAPSQKASTPSWHKRTEPMPARRKASTPFSTGSAPAPAADARCYIAPHAANAAKLIQVKQMPPLIFQKILARASCGIMSFQLETATMRLSDADSNHRPCHRFCRCGLGAG